jgi:hypothetical protein
LFISTVDAKATSPATCHLFDVDDDSNAVILDKKQKEKFHSCVAKLLYMAKRARPDILLAVSFLTTRVNQPTEHDWNKLIRIRNYMNQNKSLSLVLSVDHENLVLHEFIDASFAVHSNGRSHTGACSIFLKGAVRSSSRKQNLVSKSSTEAELVGISDDIGNAIGLSNFLVSLGYCVKTVLHQDNMSTIALTKKGRSTSNRTRHINLRYFFIKDKIDSGELEIAYTPSDLMIGDFFTKPLQGSRFMELRNKVMGIT